MRNAPYKVLQVGCGRDHVIALLSSGKMMAWGGIGSGRTIDGSTDICATPLALNRPIEINASFKLKLVSAGFGINLGLTENNKVVSWGNSSIGIGGNNQSVAISDPELLPNLPDAKMIASGEHNFAIVDLEGRVHTWGMNVDGVLGRPTAQLNTGPDVIKDLPPIKSIVMSQGSVFTLSKEGDIFVWGSNSAGQLGLGNLESQSKPVQMITSMKPAALAAGATHVLALSPAGEVFAWGSNNKGQLGTKAVNYSPVPIKLDLPEKISGITAGLHFSLALSNTGNIYAWGWNGFGQLGLGDSIDRFQPTMIKNLAAVKSISAGHTYAVAVTSKDVLGWGNNSSGQIGSTSSKVSRPNSFLSIA